MNLSSASDDNDEEFKKVELEVKKKAVKSKGKRSGVSAEAYGKFNRKVSFKYIKCYKNLEQITKIKSMIMKSFLFIISIGILFFISVKQFSSNKSNLFFAASEVILAR